MTAPAPGTRRSGRRRHPAGRARRAVAVASVTASVLLAGWLRLAAPAAPVDAGGATTGATPGTVPTTTVDTDGGDRWGGTSDAGSTTDTWGAQPATPAPTPDTTTSGS